VTVEGACPFAREESLMGAAICCTGLTKFYGRTRGVEGLDLTVEPGQVFGFLGPNGAGKTTTIRLLLDFIRPTRGRVEVLGMDPSRDGLRLRRRLGYLPGELALYERLTGEQLLRFFAGLRGLHDLGDGHELAERFGLDLSRPIHTLSKGNKQKLGLVQAFLHRPELLVLDEPTSGLDPLVQREFHRLAREVAAEGRTVFLSSHVLSEVQELADRAAIVRAGHLIAVEDVDALKARAGRHVELRFASPVPAADFRNLPGVRDLRVAGPVVSCTVEGEVDALVKAAARHRVLALSSAEVDLEDVFLSYYREEGASDAA
jgi:ABC-2 type transport system ATP-binding protein